VVEGLLPGVKMLFSLLKSKSLSFELFFPEVTESFAFGHRPLTFGQLGLPSRDVSFSRFDRFGESQNVFFHDRGEFVVDEKGKAPSCRDPDHLAVTLPYGPL
jgi:hypothetical protein